MKKRDIALFRELGRLCKLTPAAMKHLRRVTGKFGYSQISPLDEKRWSQKCWDSYRILTDMVTIIQCGAFGIEKQEEFLEDFIKTVPTTGFVGKHITEPLNFEKLPFYGDGNVKSFLDKIHICQPDYSQKWKHIPAPHKGNTGLLKFK